MRKKMDLVLTGTLRLRGNRALSHCSPGWDTGQVGAHCSEAWVIVFKSVWTPSGTSSLPRKTPLKPLENHIFTFSKPLLQWGKTPTVTSNQSPPKEARSLYRAVPTASCFLYTLPFPRLNSWFLYSVAFPGPTPLSFGRGALWALLSGSGLFICASWVRGLCLAASVRSPLLPSQTTLCNSALRLEFPNKPALICPRHVVEMKQVPYLWFESLPYL